jgi:glycosyltransferase involved in cell wall biosynthesis
MTLPTYVLITPARNEAQFIELTIQSVVAQTVRPLKWVIVSDGSTDGTDEIVSRYALDHPWIELVRMPERRERHFAGKVHAFRAGHAVVKDLDYSVIGSMDADISFDDEYFSWPRTLRSGWLARLSRTIRCTTIASSASNMSLAHANCFDGSALRKLAGMFRQSRAESIISRYSRRE